MSKTPRIRLDQLLVERGLAPSRSGARGLIMAGLVEVGGRIVDKAGTAVLADAPLHLKERPRFVSRGGDKLAFALEVFGLDVVGKRVLDLGSSTGGFVDCLVQAGAAEVVAVDVGYGQLDARLREDPRVHVLDRTNARYLLPQDLPFRPDFLTADLSFISLEKVLPAVDACMAPGYSAVLLMKPQFEAGPEGVSKGGVVRRISVRQEVLLRLMHFVQVELGLAVRGLAESALRGPAGNVEYLLWCEKGGTRLAPGALMEWAEHVGRGAVQVAHTKNGVVSLEGAGSGGTNGRTRF